MMESILTHLTMGYYILDLFMRELEHLEHSLSARDY